MANSSVCWGQKFILHTHTHSHILLANLIGLGVILFHCKQSQGKCMENLYDRFELRKIQKEGQTWKRYRSVREAMVHLILH